MLVSYTMSTPAEVFAWLNAGVPLAMVKVTVPSPLSLALTPDSIFVVMEASKIFNDFATYRVCAGNASVTMMLSAFDTTSCTLMRQRITPLELAV